MHVYFSLKFVSNFTLSILALNTLKGFSKLFNIFELVSLLVSVLCELSNI